MNTRGVAKRWTRWLVFALLGACAGLAVLAGWLQAQATPRDVVAQLPQPVHAQTERAPAQRNLPLIDLGTQVKSLRIDTQTEYWIDEATQTSIEQIEARASSGRELFKPRMERQRHDVHGKVLWLRFEVEITDPSARWFLRVALASLDHATLYWRDANQQWMQLQAGDAVPRLQWPVRDRVPTFQLSHQQQGPTVYYLRIEHARVAFSAPLSLMRDTELAAQSRQEYLFLGMYIGLAALVTLTGIAMGLRMRETSFLTYALYTGSMLVWQLAYLGLGPQYLWPQATVFTDIANHVLPQWVCITALIFIAQTLKPHLLAPRLGQMIQLLMAGLLVIAVISALSTAREPYQIASVMMALAVLVVFGVIGYALLRGDRHARWIALGFALIGLGAITPLARNLGLASTGVLSQYGLAIASALEMPILLYALMTRSAERREARARAAGLPRHDALTGLPNLRALLTQLHSAVTRAQRYGHQYGLMLVELVNHEWFAREHGREMADRALVLTATRLQQVTRDVDTVCRLQDNQFVLIIDGPCTPGLMAKMATRVAACAQQPSDALPIGASLKLRASCALMPDARAPELSDDANAQIAWLVHTAESLPEEPRKLVRTINF